jgi:hypothetical protein
LVDNSICANILFSFAGGVRFHGYPDAQKPQLDNLGLLYLQKRSSSIPGVLKLDYARLFPQTAE